MLWDRVQQHRVLAINTATYLYMVDFAAEHGIEYLLIDEGWSERDDLLTLNPEMDMPAVCRHAAEKGVGIMLWAKWINVVDAVVAGVADDAKMVNFYRFVWSFHGHPHQDGRNSADDTRRSRVSWSIAPPRVTT